MTVSVAKINLQLPGLQKGVEAERNSVQIPKLCQMHNDYHIFHVWLRLQTEGIH